MNEKMRDHININQNKAGGHLDGSAGWGSDSEFQLRL